MKSEKLKLKIITPSFRLLTSDLKKGFTLLELLIVLTIIGIASAIVGITLYGGLGDLKLKSTAKEIAATLRYARSQAISEKRVYFFGLDPEKKYYYMSVWIPTGSPSSQSSQLSGEGWTRKKTIPEGITLVDKDSVYIFFYPLGSSTGGRFSIVNKKGTVWTILTEPATGKVSIIK